ncbi:MAG: flippase activity-associated protein Agl23, partial [Thermomicrobiales bacterium]
MRRAETPLDRGLDLTRVSPWILAWATVIVSAMAIRLAALDTYALDVEEARRSFFGFALVEGTPLRAGESLPTVGPLPLLLQALGFFLFGVTDAIARLMPALVGVAMVPLAIGLRPFIGRTAAFAAAALLAFSPVVVYASRVVGPDILIATLALGLVVTVLRTGLPGTGEGAIRRGAAIAGILIAAMIASGPAAISVLVCLAVAMAAAASSGPKDQPSAIRDAVRAVVRSPGALAGTYATLILTSIVLFTRLFSDLTAISGLTSTIGDWVRLLFTDSTSTPIQFFLIAILLYEIVAVVFAIVAASLRPGTTPVSASEYGPAGREMTGPSLDWTFFAWWALAALVLFSFSGGRLPEHTVHVATPAALLGGIGLGLVIRRVAAAFNQRARANALLFAGLGAVIGLVAFAILIGRTTGDSALVADKGSLTIQAILVGVVVFGGSLAAGYLAAFGSPVETRPRFPGSVLLAVLLVVLGLYSVRTAFTLSFFRADEGVEPIAQQTATTGIEPLVARMRRLSRDVSVDRTSVADPLGTYGMSVAIDERVEWPYRWYFREFTDVTVTASGQAATVGAEVVLAPEDTGTAEAGYTPRSYPYLNRVPAAFTTPDLGSIAASAVQPTRWWDGVNFLLYRDGTVEPDAQTVQVAFNQDISRRLFPNSGPFALLDRVGPGSGRGQFSSPRGIAVDPANGTTYLVDSGNLEIDRYDASGTYIGSWGDVEAGSSIQLGSFTNAAGTVSGPAGIAVSPDGLVFVADTWSHRVIGIGPDGTIAREIGQPGQQTDTGDDPARLNDSPGLFYGPRDVVVYEDEIYVVDTGNERVQVFGLDGTFRRAIGGYGTEPGRLREPVGIAIGPDGLLYVADSDNGRVSVFQTDGTPVTNWPVEAWSGSGYFEPYMAFGPDGNLYLTSKDSGSVEVYDTEGTLIESITVINGIAVDGPVGITATGDGS